MSRIHLAHLLRLRLAIYINDKASPARAVKLAEVEGLIEAEKLRLKTEVK